MVPPPRSGIAAITRWLVVATALVLAPAQAAADNVSDLIGQLERGPNEKIRLSAALGLSQLADQRGVQPLIDALKDSDRNVRAAAAIGLGKVVTGQTTPALQKAAIGALEAAARSDKSSIVRTRAKDSARTIGQLGSGSTGPGDTTAVPSGGVFVDIGPMAATDPKLKAAMRSTTSGMLAKSAKSMMTTWPGGKPPTAAQLAAKGMLAFHIDGTVVEVKSSGDVVSCKISMLIATYPDKSMFGFLKGGASVQGGTTDRDKADCVSAVVEDMVVKKIVPTIKTKAGLP